MSSVNISPYRTKHGESRWRVTFRLGGRETPSQHGGSFKRKAEAEKRRNWIAGELAAMRVPDLRLVVPPSPETFRMVAEQWRASRIDVAEGTDDTYITSLGRIMPVFGDRSIASITPTDVSGLIAGLHRDGLKRESIRKTKSHLAMVLDFADIEPNPARHRWVKLPPDDREEVNPPTAQHVLAVYSILPREYRLPTLVYDATGMRVTELERLAWRDVDESEGRWRVGRLEAKTKYARWVPVHDVSVRGASLVFATVMALTPREDRDLAAAVFPRFSGDAFRTALGRACKAVGVPEFSPNDLRHRRATLWHLGGVPVGRAALWLGHSAKVHLDTYQHANMDDLTELDYEELLVLHRPARMRARGAASVPHRS